MKIFCKWLEEIIQQQQQQQPLQFRGGNPNNVAQDFYLYMEQTYPGLQLGIVGSGNCAWTAQEFFKWSKGNSQILAFPHSQREEQAHIVPVYNGYLIDYIQAFTYGQKWKIHMVKNPTKGRLIPLREGGLADAYGTWYDFYILGNSVQDIESVQGYEIKTYECPMIPK
jgi:hypothetical protein